MKLSNYDCDSTIEYKIEGVTQKIIMLKSIDGSSKKISYQLDDNKYNIYYKTKNGIVVHNITEELIEFLNTIKNKLK